MTILFWLIFGPILFWGIIRIYNGFVADFAPDKKRRKQAVEDEKRLSEVSERWFEWWVGFFWKIIKFIFKWALPVGFVIFIVFLLMGGEIDH